MRRHFIPALESQDVSTHGVLSIEDEQVMLAEASADAADIAQDLSEAERIIEVSDALEDLAVIADSIEEATPQEIALIQTAGDMAVAGSDTDAEEVVPSMEAFKGGRISTEGLRETAMTIWKNILEFLKKVWARIEKFFYNLFGTIPSIRARIKKLRERAEDAYQKKLEGEDKNFTVSSGVASVCIDFKPVANGAEVLKAVESLTTAAQFVYGSNIEARSKLGESIADAISNFDPEGDLSSQAGKISQAYAVHASKQAVPGSSSAPTGFSGFEVKAGAQLLGNVRLVSKNFKESAAGTDAKLGELDRYRRSGIELMSARDSGGSTPGDFKFATMDLGNVEALLGKVEALLDVLEEYKRGKASKDVEKAKKKLEDASTKAAKQFEKMGSGEIDSKERKALPTYKAMVNFNEAFARWVQQPAVPFATHAITSVSAILSLAQKSVSMYK